jgi:hypothetical protein
MHTGSITIHRINIWAATRIGAAAGLMQWTVFGLIFSIAQYSSLFRSSEGQIWLRYGLGLIASPLLAGISAAVSAFMINVALRWIGGLEVQVSGDGLTREQGSGRS